MKKIIILTTLALMSFSVACFAANELAGVGGLVSLSNNVVGKYYVDATPATAFAMSTGHTQGNRAYATGSFSTAIHYKNGTGGSGLFQTSDLLGAPASATAYNSAHLTAWDDGEM